MIIELNSKKEFYVDDQILKMYGFSPEKSWEQNQEILQNLYDDDVLEERFHYEDRFDWIFLDFED